MGTIIKSILRFFKTSKMAIIGLFLLIFFSSSIFTLLNSTTTNLERSYERISSQGNIHDFVINEHFSIGTADYEIVEPSKDQNGKKLYTFRPSTFNSDGKDINWTGSYLKVYLHETSQEVSNNYYISNFVNFSKEFDPSNGNIEVQVQNFLSFKKNKLTEFTKLKIKEYFYTDLENIQPKNSISDIRNFKAIDLNNNKQKMFFKAVESSPKFNIDKVVYYSGNQLSNTNTVYDLIFNTKETDEKNIQTFLITKYLYLSKWSDTNRNEYKQIKEFWSFLLDNQNFKSYDDTIPAAIVNKSDIEKGQKIAKEFYDSVKNLDYKGVYSIVNKGFQIFFNINGTVPLTMFYDDFSSYEIVVSPYYAKKLGKTPIDINLWNQHKNDSQIEFDKFFKNIPENNKIEIDQMKFILIGTGVSPDFMYPIVSFQNLVPNKEVEQVIYLNPNGYQKVYDSNRGSVVEEFVVGTFAKTIPKKDYLKIINEINKISRNYMAWPENIDAAYLFDDSRNVLFPTALRVQFIPQTVQIANVVSLFMTSFVLLLSIFVSIIIIKRFIEMNRSSLGIMQANGYRKREIILGLNIFIGLPTSIATIFGYIIGFLLQTAAIDLLGNFWTIPTELLGFSLLYLILICVVLTFLFILITTIYSWWALKGETSEFMKDDAKYKMSRISRAMKLPFSKFSIISRFRAAIAFSSLWRLFVLSIMASLLMISLTFSFAVLNKFEISSQKSFAARNYVYSMNLITPSLQSGQYYAVPYDKQGMTLKKNIYFNKDLFEIDRIQNSTLKNEFISEWYFDKGPYSDSKYTSNKELKDFNTLYGNYQLVSMNDSSDMKNDITYTKNKTSTKTFINFLVGLKGIPGLSANPWSIAESMMPPNNASYANNSYNEMLTRAYYDKESMIKIKINNDSTPTLHSYKEIIDYYTIHETGTPSASSFKILYEENGDIKNTDYYRSFDDSKIIDKNILTPRILPDFLLFLYSLYSNEKYKDFSYSVNYNKLVVNADKENIDEPYSYMDFKISKINNKSVDIIDNLRTIGFKKNSSKIILKNEYDYLINNKLDEVLSIGDDNIEYHPIIINAFSAKKYGLKINDTLEVDVSNTTDRFSRKLHNAEKQIVKANLKIVEIASTYQGSEFYMNQYDVNKILGLPINGFIPNKPKSKQEIDSIDKVNWENVNLPEKKYFISERSGFNGIFTSDPNKLVEVTNGVSIYSPSGLYPGTDKFTSPIIKTLINKSKEKEKIEEILGFNKGELTSKTTEEILNLIINTFGESTAYTILSDATSKNAMLSVFEGVTSTTNDIQKVVLSIIIIVSFIIVVIISAIIINDSMKLAGILKCLGFRDSRNAFTFLTVYFPVLIIGLVIAVPLSFLINSIYINVIFSFAGILLTIPFVWWHYLLSTAIIIFIFLISYSITWFRIRNMNLTQAIK